MQSAASSGRPKRPASGNSDNIAGKRTPGAVNMQADADSTIEAESMRQEEDSDVNGSKCIVPRLYQEDLLQRALARNIIVPLGTGTGKTYIAVMLLKEMAADTKVPISEGGKRSVFLVDKVSVLRFRNDHKFGGEPCVVGKRDRIGNLKIELANLNTFLVESYLKFLTVQAAVPLVRQQAEQIRMHSSLLVGEFFGAMGIDLWTKAVWEKELEKYQVLVMTAQILMNMLVHGYVSISALNVIVVDECHHATKNHPYRQIMSRYKECTGERPRILGLTASVVNSHLTGLELKLQMNALESIMCSNIETTDEVESYRKVATKPEIKVRVCPDDGTASCVQWSRPIGLFIKELATLYKKVNIGSDDNFAQLKSFVLDLLSKAQTALSKVGAWSVNRLFLRQERSLREKIEDGISHAYCQNEKLLLKVALSTMETIKAYLKRRISSVSSVDQLKLLVIPRVVELLSCLQDCNPGTSAVGEVAPFCGIIFVTQRYVAYQLKVLLEEVISLDPDTYGYLRVGFVVGQAQKRGTVQNAFVSEQYRHQEETLRRFRSGELNLVVATSILEEGIDVPQCNVVIRFDLPKNFSSYVQSKGRARMRDANYAIIVQKSESVNFCKILKSYEEMEEMLIKHQSDATEVLDILRRSSTIDSLMPAYYGPPVTCLNGVDRAVVTMSTSLYVLNRYCMSLPSDQYTVPSARFEFASSTNSSGLLCYTATLFLPLNCPVKEKITGAPMSNRKLAKMAAALKACALLHKRGELSDHMLPASKCTESADAEMPNADDDDYDEGEFVEFTERKIATCCYRREVYKKKVPLCLSAPLRAHVPLFLCDVEITVPVNLLDISFEKSRFDAGKNETFGLLCGAPLPRMPRFEIFAAEEEVNVRFVQVGQPALVLTEDELQSLFQVQRYLFAELLKFNSSLITYNVEDSGWAICVVPLIKDDTKNCAINWALIGKLLHQISLLNSRPTDEERKSFVFEEASYIDAVILPWYHKRRDVDDIVRVVAIRNDLNPLSACGFGEYSSFADYYEKYHGVKIFNLAQPLLSGEYFRPKLNMIRRRDGGEPKALLVSPPRIGAMFVPELVYIHPFRWSMWFQLSCLPTVLYRLRCLTVAEELRSTIHKEAFLSYDARPIVEPEEEAIDSNWCRVNGYASRDNRVRLAKEGVNGASSSEAAVGVLIRFEGMDESYFENACNTQPTSASDGVPLSPLSIPKELDEEELFFCGTATPPDEHDETKNVCENSTPPSVSPAEALAESLLKSSAVASFFNAPPMGFSPWPQLREILLALTCASANDRFDLENFETLGDSFLKCAVSDCLFKSHPSKHQGHLTDLRTREIRNFNLCEVGKRIGLGGVIFAQEFKPKINWLPPGFVMRQEVDIGELGCGPADAEENLQSVEQQVVSDKRVADCVEALIGVYVRSCGHDRTLRFMEWLGLSVFSEAELDPPAVTSPEALEHVWDRLQLEKFERILRYNFKNRAYLVQALTHSSYCRPSVFENYERMEFLGDAVLDYLITRFIFERELYKTPGLLTDIRAALVNNTIFASIAVKFDFQKYLMSSSPTLYRVVGNFVKLLSDLNEDVNLNTELCLSGDLEDPDKDIEEQEVPKVLGDIFESVAAAIYLDSGCSLEAVWRTYYPMMKAQIDKCCANTPMSPVRQLLELDPTAVFASCYDRSTQKTRVKVTVKGEREFIGVGRSRWLAKNTASKRALHYLKQTAEQCASETNHSGALLTE